MCSENLRITRTRMHQWNKVFCACDLTVEGKKRRALEIIRCGSFGRDKRSCNDENLFWLLPPRFIVVRKSLHWRWRKMIVNRLKTIEKSRHVETFMDEWSRFFSFFFRSCLTSLRHGDNLVQRDRMMTHSRSIIIIERSLRSNHASIIQGQKNRNFVCIF